ncbi:MAG: hypothetical protein ACJ8CN_00005 [Gemmatimonadales bacterium]
MAGHRDDEKKRRHKRRLEERRGREPRAPTSRPAEGPEGAVERIEHVLAHLEDHLRTPAPACWPGAVDPSLQRPDMVKYDLALFATERPPGREKVRQFERDLRKGLIGFLPQLDHWTLEEFIYHGPPGDAWHPIDAYLAQATRYPPRAAEQLRLWKQARIGLYEVGDVADDTVGLREWDPVGGRHAGPACRAIFLSLGGVNIFRGASGSVVLTYLAPWRPDLNLFCGLGYSSHSPKALALPLRPYLDLRSPEVVARPLPWRATPAAAEQHRRAWQRREWHGWLRERITFPFLAYLTLPGGEISLVRVEGAVSFD